MSYRLSSQIFMAKKITALIKLALPAGKATPAPPVGPALGQHGVNIAAFCKEYNARTNARHFGARNLCLCQCRRLFSLSTRQQLPIRLIAQHWPRFYRRLQP